MIGLGFGPQVCGDLAAGTTREWLLTDGLGGYAMGTVSGLRTRRYHALLVVSGDVPASRHVGLVALDPVVTLPSGAQVRLATHEWASGAVEPKGHHLIERFDLADGIPRWRYRIGDVVIEREIAMTHRRPGVAVVHRLISGGSGGAVRLSLDALCTWRDAHGERYADGPPPRVIPTADGAVVEQAYRMAGPGWTPTGQWWRGVHHREEAARGLASEEDVWYAGRFGGTLDQPGDTLEVLAWAGDLDDRPDPAVVEVSGARDHNRSVMAAAHPDDAVAATLALAADAFIVRTAAGPDVVAGYPWFGAWSRDTMTAYEGLFLTTRRWDEGRELLRAYAGTLSQGMLANTADTGSVEYNTCDATMWFLHAVDRHVAVTGDTDLAAELLPALRGVVDAHLAGTRYGIRADPADGLLTQGAPGEALTWMDARVYGVPVTPRAGKPVEVNALWVNGLAAIVDLASRTGQDPGAAVKAHARALDSFRTRYPSPAGWLYDVLDGPGGNDMSLRPNQLLAWSLPRAPLEPDESALAMIGAALMTPLGPRSLAPDSPGFTGRHRGSSAQRDAAYHQGTVWPWTIGPYADACRRAGWRIGELFTGIESHLPEFGLASVSETADGYAPHAATGCPFQGWSVAEALRARRF